MSPASINKPVAIINRYVRDFHSVHVAASSCHSPFILVAAPPLFFRSLALSLSPSSTSSTSFLSLFLFFNVQKRYFIRRF